MTISPGHIAPNVDQRRTFAHVHEALERAHKAGCPAIVCADGESLPIPEPLYDLLIQALRQLERGRAVSIVATNQELTTQQAAETLNISRPFLIRLLDEKQLPYRMVGTHRRLALEDVLAYRQTRSKSRRKLLGELARDAQKSGTYA